jgi:hypothetical protein
MVLAHYRAKGVGPAAPADQPTISAHTVSKETEISLVTLVTEFRLVFILLCAFRRDELEFFFIAVPSKIKTLTKRSAIDNKRTLIISQPAGIEPPSTPKSIYLLYRLLGELQDFTRSGTVRFKGMLDSIPLERKNEYRAGSDGWLFPRG